MNDKLKLQINIIRTAIAYLAFAIYTILVGIVDVEQIGPNRSKVGFSHLNAAFHKMTGVHSTIYALTDILAIAALLIMIGFATYGILQLLKRKSFLKVDKELYALAFTYILMIVIYVFFEKFIINYRPVLIDEVLEASYPSSHSMLAMTVFITALFEFSYIIKDIKILRTIQGALIILTALTVIGRLFCGVHWLTDVIGSVLISVPLIMSYHSISLLLNCIDKKKEA